MNISTFLFINQQHLKKRFEYEDPPETIKVRGRKNIIFMHFQSSQISSLLKVNFSHHCCFAEAADK